MILIRNNNDRLLRQQFQIATRNIENKATNA